MYKFPWTNFHELNLDWVIAKLKEIKDKAVYSVNGVLPDGNGNISLPTLSAVSTVNNIGPDAGGNVDLPARSVPGSVLTVNQQGPDMTGAINLNANNIPGAVTSINNKYLPVSGNVTVPIFNDSTAIDYVSFYDLCVLNGGGYIFMSFIIPGRFEALNSYTYSIKADSFSLLTPKNSFVTVQAKEITAIDLYHVEYINNVMKIVLQLTTTNDDVKQNAGIAITNGVQITITPTVGKQRTNTQYHPIGPDPIP